MKSLTRQSSINKDFCTASGVTVFKDGKSGNNLKRGYYFSRVTLEEEVPVSSSERGAVRFLSINPWFIRNTILYLLRPLVIPTLDDYIKAQAQHLLDSANSSEWDHIRAWSSREGPAPLHNLRRPGYCWTTLPRRLIHLDLPSTEYASTASFSAILLWDQKL
ncbi:hypothetical protein J6590_063557 [Homalodisca vitripennis]|nr:hypothetical protein J6590_063557 [Homalodisca vitripennis]